MVRVINCPEPSCKENWTYNSLSTTSFVEAETKCWDHARTAHGIGADTNPVDDGERS